MQFLAKNRNSILHHIFQDTLAYAPKAFQLPHLKLANEYVFLHSNIYRPEQSPAKSKFQSFPYLHQKLLTQNVLGKASFDTLHQGSHKQTSRIFSPDRSTNKLLLLETALKPQIF